MQLSIFNVSEIKTEKVTKTGDNGSNPYDVVRIYITDEKGTHELTFYGDDNKPIIMKGDSE